MVKLIAVFALVVMTVSAAWPQDNFITQRDLPVQDFKFPLSPRTSCELVITMSLDGSTQAEDYYKAASQPLATPLEQQMLARVQHEVSQWWLATNSHDAKALNDVVARSISVLPSGVRCRVKATLFIIIPVLKQNDASCQVQPSAAPLFFILYLVGQKKLAYY